MSKYTVGDLHVNNNGCEFRILRLYADGTADIMFTDEYGYQYNTWQQSIGRGETRNPFQTTVMGKGRLGKGPFRAKMKNRSPATVEYRIWVAILTACYDAHYINKKPSTMYHTVCDEWLDYQVFAKWLLNLGYYDSTVFVFNQSLLGKGSTVYSPETCCYIPIRIRNHLITTRKRGEGILPQGVTWCKRTGSYVAQISLNKHTSLGRFDRVSLAALAYKEAKENYVKDVANEYKHELEPRVYDALMSWTYTSI